MVGVLAAAFACAPPEPPDRPDILLVSLDTLRADHLSLYGYARRTSPMLDRFAGERCAVFERSLSSSTWTLPSHATMLTGLLPGEHGAASLERRLPDGVATVAERMRAAGYSAAAVTDGGYLSPAWGLARGFESYLVAGAEGRPKDARRVFEAAGRTLDRLRRGKEPAFLFVHTYETHQPYVNREGFADDFLDPTYAGPFEDDAVLGSRFAGELPEAEARRIVDLYDGEIRRLDHYLGRFLDRAWAQRGQRGLLILLTSDHGEAFGEHGRYEHAVGTVEDENLAVPMLLCGTGVEPNRSRVRTTTLDVAPTILDIAAASSPHPLLGRSLRALREHTRRWSIAHGFSSLPTFHEEWLRVEGDDGRLMVDVGRGHASALTGGGESLAARALVALARGRGARYLAVVPEGLEEIGWSPESVSVVAVLDDARWQPRAVGPAQARARLAAGSSSLLLLRGGALASLGAFRLRLDGGQRLVAESTDARTDPVATHLLEASSIPPLVLLDGGVHLASRPARPDAEAVRELRALGYL